MFAVICNMMVSQLEEDVNKTVIVIETFNQFPWQLFSQHPRYEEAWMSRIKRFYLPTFAQVLSFFMLNPLKSLANSAFVIIVNFHEVVEYYRYQIVVSFEEALLKHQIERNSVVIDNFRKDENGGNHEQSVPTLDGQSSLANEIAAAKADKDTGTGNIIDPIYFDFNHKLYGKESIENDWLIDLSDAPDEDLSSFLEESISSTQEQLKPPYERARKRSKLAEQVPSSPVRWEYASTGNRRF
ncbi:hypothetical protein CXQ85_000579 [Candidozyma haemuli]|uniref:Uncharacterized protein n=1 Tax=Candidozyma haemuli TaxID=45357 RepID=A0A2V1ATV6_9ASCO|nr:hypothetical protein CXQ85_000579 [[Candida] haemuloni]PVH21597.1 hypothetical protein CXQ85_000579 [[Candida] haemuloni]